MSILPGALDPNHFEQSRVHTSSRGLVLIPTISAPCFVPKLYSEGIPRYFQGFFASVQQLGGVPPV